MKVTTLNTNDFEEQSKQLFSKIDFEPDLVVGIIKGGEFVLEEFKKTNKGEGVIYETLKCQRSTTKGLKQNKFVQAVLRLMSYTILDKMRIVEHKKRLKNTALISKYIENVDINFASDTKNITHILVLDDALDSGQTMQSVVNVLLEKFPDANIKTAVLAWTNSNSVIKPNYFLKKNVLIRFPWSLDFKTKRHG